MTLCCARSTPKLVALAVLIGASIGCHQTPAEPTPICQTNNTGSVSFGNRSTATIYNIVWDGIQIVSDLQPGQTSQPVTAAAGIAHSLVFRDTQNRVNRGCTVSQPILIRCEATTLTCSF